MSRFQLHNRTHSRMREARNNVLELLAVDVAIDNLDVVLKTSETQDKREESDLAIQEPLHIILTGDERSKYVVKWRSY